MSGTFGFPGISFILAGRFPTLETYTLRLKSSLTASDLLQQSLKIGFDRSSGASNHARSPSHSWMVHFVRGWADLGALTRNDKSEVMATRICGKHCLEDVEITEAMAILVGTVMAKSAGLQPLIIES